MDKHNMETNRAVCAGVSVGILFFAAYLSTKGEWRIVSGLLILCMITTGMVLFITGYLHRDDSE